MFNDPELLQQLNQLMKMGRHKQFFNLTYRKLIENTDILFDNDGVDIQYKREQVQNVLNYFTEHEEFEKCVELKKIIQKVDDYINNNGATDQID